MNTEDPPQQRRHRGLHGFAIRLSAASGFSPISITGMTTMKQQKSQKSDEAKRTGSRDELADLLNEDLAREYQAIVSYVVYSQVLKGAEFMSIADQLQAHAQQTKRLGAIARPAAGRACPGRSERPSSGSRDARPRAGGGRARAPRQTCRQAADGLVEFSRGAQGAPRAARAAFTRDASNDIPKG